MSYSVDTDQIPCSATTDQGLHCLLRPVYPNTMGIYSMLLFMLGFNDTSTLVGHFVLSPREREKKDSRGDVREEQGRKGNRK